MYEYIVNGLISVVTAAVTWFLARKKYYSEVDTNYIENMQKSLEFYEKLADDNKKRLEELTDRNTKLEHEVVELRKQILKLTQEVNIIRTKSIKNNSTKKSSTKKK